MLLDRDYKHQYKFSSVQERIFLELKELLQVSELEEITPVTCRTLPGSFLS